MVSTFTSYQLIARDVGKSLANVARDPVVARETEYYQENIGKVTSIDEFVADTRLFNYAMKAHGLADMAYAKAFMVKALKEGIGSAESFANKLTDKRYADFVKTYNFAAHGANTGEYSQARQGTATRYQLAAALNGVLPNDPLLKAQTEHYLANIGKATSLDQFMKDDALFSFAMKAYGLEDRLGDKTFMRQILEGGVKDPDSLANRQKDPKYAEFASVFNFAEHGGGATSHRPAVEGAVAKYMRQTLEENAGAQNEGVRLALYFERKAATLTSPYQLLADKALGDVVRTTLGLPDEVVRADVDRQAAMLKDRIDFGDFKDPVKLNKFLARFTTMYEMKHGSPAPAVSASILFARDVSFGISTDALLTLQKLRGKT